MADTAQKETEDQECPICYEPLTGSLFRQPICDHAFHEKCWHNHLLTYKSDPVRCQRCLQPVDQKAVHWILKEVSRLGPRLPTDENRQKVEELLSQLVALGESGLLEGGGLTCASLVEDGPVRTTAHAVLFAQSVLDKLRQGDQAPNTSNQAQHIEQLAYLHQPRQIVDLAALVWEKEPKSAIRVPFISKLLRLENGTAQVHFILGKLLFTHEVFRDFGRATIHLCEAWRQEHPDVVSWMLKEVPQLGVDLVAEENRVNVKELLTQLVAMGESRLLEGEAMTRTALTEEGTLRTTAHAVLFAHYVLALLGEADRCPDTFDRRKHAKQLKLLREPRQIVDLAALLWDKEPEAAVRFACITRLLNLENSTAEAHFHLGKLCRFGPFEDFDRAERHLREAWRQHHPDADVLLLKVLGGLRGKDSELHDMCEQLLSIDQNHAEANYQLGKLYLEQDNLEAAELHLRRAFDSGKPFALLDLGKAFQDRGALNQAKRCFWDVHHSWGDGWGAKCEAREALAELLYREGAREDSLRLALIDRVARDLEGRNSKRATSRLRDSMYWEPAMAALHDIEAEGAVAFFSEVEQYFRQGCHDLTEGILEKLLGGWDVLVLIMFGWGYEEQSQLRKAARCYRKAILLADDFPKPYLVAEMSLVHLRWKLQDPRAQQEKAKIAAVTAEMPWHGPKKRLDKLEGMSFRTVVPKSIRALFFEDAAPLQAPAAAEEPIPLPDAPRISSAPANPPHQPPPAAAEEPLPSGISAGGGSSTPANPPPQPLRVVPPAFAPQRDGDGERDLQSQLPPVLLRPQPVPLPEDTLDDQDPNFQAALLLSCAEQRDQLLAARTNSVLMRAQQQLLQPVPEEPEQGEKLFLLHFQRSSREFQARLHQGLLLAPCRTALEAAGLPWLLEDETGHTGTFVGRFGVKVFVHPSQYQTATKFLSEAMSQMLSQQPPKHLFPRHVVVAESLLPLLLESLEGCPGATLKPNGQVELGEVPLPRMAAESNDPTESLSTSTNPLHVFLHVANLGVQKTFLSTPAAMHHGQVAHSDGPPSANPRRRKARSSRSSKSQAAPEESTASPLGPGTKSTGTGNSLRRKTSSCADQAADDVVSGIPLALLGVPAAGAKPGAVQGSPAPTKETTQPGCPVPSPASSALPGAVQGPQAPTKETTQPGCHVPSPAAGATPGDTQGPQAPTKETVQPGCPVPSPAAGATPGAVQGHPAPTKETTQPGFLVPSPAAGAMPGAVQGHPAPTETALLSVEAPGQPTSGLARTLPPPAPAATDDELPASPLEVGSSPPAAPETPAPGAQEDIKMQLATSSVAEATEAGSSLPAPRGTNKQLPTSPVAEVSEAGSSLPAPQGSNKQLTTSPVAETTEVGSFLPAPPGTNKQLTTSPVAEATEFGSSMPAPPGTNKQLTTLPVAEATEFASFSPTPPGTTAASSVRAGAGPLPRSSSPTPPGTAAASSVRAGAGPLPCSSSPAPPGTAAASSVRAEAGPLPCSLSPTPPGTAAASSVRAGAGPLPCRSCCFTGLMAGVGLFRGPAFGASRGHAIRHGDGQE